MSGFITLHREALEHPLLSGDAARLGAWFWLVAKACWKPTKFDIGGKIITLERGQLCVSRSQLAEAWGWKPSAVERFLTRLQTEQMIGRATGQGRSVVTICNYSKYQDQNDEPGQATGQEDEGGATRTGGRLKTGQATGQAERLVTTEKITEFANINSEPGQATGQQSDSHRTAKEQGNKGTSVEEDKSSPTRRASPAKKFAMPADWQPGPLPADIAELVAQWPRGRFDREVADVRAYWIEDGTKRPGWDRTLHSRIRTIHDRVMRESRNGNHQSPRDNRDGTFKTLERQLFGDRPEHAPGQAGRFDAGEGGGDGVIPLARARPM